MLRLLCFEVYHNKVRTSLIKTGSSRKSAGRARRRERQLWVARDSVCHLRQLQGGRIIVLISFTWMKRRLLEVVKYCEVGEIKVLKHSVTEIIAVSVGRRTTSERFGVLRNYLSLVLFLGTRRCSA